MCATIVVLFVPSELFIEVLVDYFAANRIFSHTYTLFRTTQMNALFPAFYSMGGYFNDDSANYYVAP